MSSLVERGGEVRSFHVTGSTTNEVIPKVRENISREAQIMTDNAQHRHRLASHDRVNHSQNEYARYEEGRPVIHTNTVEGYFALFGGIRFSSQQPRSKGRTSWA